MSNPEDVRHLLTIDQVLATARERLDSGPYIWAASGAGQGVTAARNIAALNRLALVPRVLTDVEHLDTSSSLVGVPLALPVFLAPVGALDLYHPDDGVAASMAAVEMATSAMVSTLVDSRWEDVAATAPGRHFFQLYVFGDRSWTADVVSRVESARFAGICVTVDVPMIGRRDRSLEERFVWTHPSGGPPNLRPHGYDPSQRIRYGWSDLRWLCEQTELPVIVKGVMTAGDAAAAVECGAAAIYVSNHGGRQVDHGISTIEVLGEIVEAVGDDAEVVVDGGFTTGPDVCKALALGARAVGLGRLQCWGLAAGGPAGLARVLEILGEEITVTMANLGCATIGDLTPDHVRWSVPADPPGSG